MAGAGASVAAAVAEVGAAETGGPCSWDGCGCGIIMLAGTGTMTGWPLGPARRVEEKEGDKPRKSENMKGCSLCSEIARGTIACYLSCYHSPLP